MKLAILGATGRTGRCIAKQALGLGHDVKVLVRNADKLEDLRSAVEVCAGDATNAADVDRLVAGCDAVIVAIGHDSRSSGDMQTVATCNVLSAMKQHGVARLISLTGAGVIDANDRPSLVGKLFGVALRLLAKKVHDDAVQHAEAIRRSDRE